MAPTETEATEPTEESDLQVIRIVRESRSVTNDDQVELLCENQCFSEFSSQNEQLQEWVGTVFDRERASFLSKSDNLKQYAADTIRQFGTDNFYSYSNYQDQAVIRHDSRVVSLVTLSHIYSGGIHPNAVQTAENLDLAENKLLRLEDIIESSAVSRLEQLVQDSVRERFNALGLDAFYEDYPETISVSLKYGEMTPYWYFGHDSLIIFYNQYELGPYAAGIIKVELPYEQLEGIVKPEYMPQTPQDRSGDLKILESAEGYREAELIIDPDGSQVVIGATGPVYEVQVSEIFLLNETPVTQQMLISIGELSARDALVITGGVEDSNRTFAVEFSNGSDQKLTYYITTDGFSDHP